MISISSSTQFKTVCKTCNSPPSNFRKIGRFYKDNRDLIKLIQDDSKFHGFSVISPSYIVDDTLAQRINSNLKFQLSYLSFQIRDYKALTSKERRSKIGNISKIAKNPKVAASCNCGKTIWIFQVDIRDIFPESSRKSNITK